MAVPKTEESLLYGALAVELEIADRQAVVRALEAWAGDPSRSIADHLDTLGNLDPDARARIEAAVRDELARHGDDPARVLATLPSAADLRAGLAGSAWSADEDDPMATVVGEAPHPAPSPPEDSLPPTEADPFATRADPFPAIPEFQGGSDINPIPSGLRARDDRGGTGTGSVPTPDLRPLSSIVIPSGRPSTGSGFGSGLPRFDPLDTPGVEIKSPPGFDPEATSDGGQLEETQRSPDATTFPDAGHVHDPMATSAFGMEATGQGFVPGSGSGSGSSMGMGAFGYSGTTSSRFKIVRPHAKGGLGAVMVAYDEELRREVALKEIQERHADNPDSRARFLIEAEITGGLEHPGVVPVYSLGRNPDGRPYYAMRFIRGDSLRKGIELFHSPDHGPKEPGERSLQLRALLRRFIDVCNALEYAHSRGVIHRDIKPDNIMLGPYGETLLVDWGLAKALDQTEVPSRTQEMPLRPASVAGSTPTLDGSAIGTPAFMSPEQAEGDLSRMGPASDIYSLGATLYQILTGAPPFTERNLFQVLIKVREGDFPHPRELKPDIPPALEAICLTAMARSVDDRYDTCRALADDLEQWLADEPVSVYREPWTVRLGRWAKRHRTLVTSLGVLLVTAVVALTVGAILIKREQVQTELAKQDAMTGWDQARQNEAEAKTQRDLAVDNAERARLNAIAAQENERQAVEARGLAQENEALAVQQRGIAEANFQSAVAAVDALLTEVGEIDLADVPQMEQTRRDLLLKAREFYEQFLSQNDGPETRHDAGRAHGRLGDIHELLGEYPQARASYDEALAIQEPLAEDNPDDQPLADDLARTRHSKAVLLKKLNEFEESQELLDQARATRSSLHDREPENLDATSNLASSIYQLGAVLARLVDRQPDARSLYEQAISLQREVVAGRDEREEDRRELARYVNNLALLLQGTKPQEADAAFEEAITLQRRLAAENSDVPHYRRELARTLDNRVRAAIVNDPESAEPSVREAIALAEQLTQDFPTVPEYWSELGGYLRNLGRLLTERGRLMNDQEAADEARALFKRSEESFRMSEGIRSELAETYSLRPEYRHRLATVRHDLATFLRLSNKAEEARTFLDPAVTELQSLTEQYPDVPEYPKDLALALSEKSYASLNEADQNAKALQLAQDGLRQAEIAATDRPNDVVYWDALMTLHRQVGKILHSQGKGREAAEHAGFLAENASGSASWLFAAAELFIRCAEAVGTDESIPQDEREPLRESYVDQAGRNLGAAAEAGFRSSTVADDAFRDYRDKEPFAGALETIRKQGEAS